MTFQSQDTSGGQPLAQVNLQTLVSAIQNAVQAQNLIATNILKLVTAFGLTYPVPLSSSAAWAPAALANDTSETTTLTVAGAAIGNYVAVSFSSSLLGLSLTAYVSAANTVTVVLSNNTGATVTLASGTLKVRVTTV